MNLSIETFVRMDLQKNVKTSSKIWKSRSKAVTLHCKKGKDISQRCRLNFLKVL